MKSRRAKTGNAHLSMILIFGDANIYTSLLVKQVAFLSQKKTQMTSRLRFSHLKLILEVTNSKYEFKKNYNSTQNTIATAFREGRKKMSNKNEKKIWTWDLIL